MTCMQYLGLWNGPTLLAYSTTCSPFLYRWFLWSALTPRQAGPAMRSNSRPFDAQLDILHEAAVYAGADE
jgi:hypothetical protein